MIREGDYYVIESFTQFREQLGVDWDEIAESFSEEGQSLILADENELRSACGDDPIDDVTEVEIDLLDQYVQDYGINTVIINVLESRDREYVHLFEGHVHRIVELYPEEWDNRSPHLVAWVSGE